MRTYIVGDGLDEHAGMSLWFTTGTAQGLEHFYVDIGLPYVRETYKNSSTFVRTKRYFISHVDSDHFLIGDVFHLKNVRLQDETIEMTGPVGFQNYLLAALNSCSPGGRSGLKVNAFSVDGGESTIDHIVFNEETGLFEFSDSDTILTPMDDNGIISLPPFGYDNRTQVDALYGFHRDRIIPVLSFAIKETKPEQINHDTDILRSNGITGGKWMGKLNKRISEVLADYEKGDVNHYVFERLISDLGDDCLPDGGDEDTLRIVIEGAKIMPEKTIKFAYITDTRVIYEDDTSAEDLPLAEQMRRGYRANFESLVSLAQDCDCLYLGVKPGKGNELLFGNEDKDNLRKGHVQVEDALNLVAEANPDRLVLMHMGMNHGAVPAVAGDLAERFEKIGKMMESYQGKIPEMTQELMEERVKHISRIYSGIYGHEISEEVVYGAMLFSILKMTFPNTTVGTSVHRPRKKMLPRSRRNIAYRVCVPTSDLRVFSSQ